MVQIACIAAMDQQRGIGKAGTLPWRLPRELQYFHGITRGENPPQSPLRKGGGDPPESPLRKGGKESRNAVIMGWRTWQSLPPKYRPMADRLNVVITRTQSDDIPADVVQVASLDDALRALAERTDVGRIFVVGGAQTYAEAIARPECTMLYLTEVEGTFDCDAFFPEIPPMFARTSQSEVQEERGIRYRFAVYERP